MDVGHFMQKKKVAISTPMRTKATMLMMGRRGEESESPEWSAASGGCGGGDVGMFIMECARSFSRLEKYWSRTYHE